MAPKISKRGGNAAQNALTTVPQSNYKYEIIGAPGNNYLKVYLDKDQSVIADRGAMIYMDGSIKLTIENMGWSAWFSGEDTTKNKFMGTIDAKSSKPYVGLAPKKSRHIIALHIGPGESWKLKDDSFFACTDNIKLSGGREWQMFGTTFVVVMANNSAGIVWLETDGITEKHDVKSDQSLKVDDGMFLCAPTHVKYTTGLAASQSGLLRNWWGSYRSGEGTVLVFKGPCVLYTRSNDAVVTDIKKIPANTGGRGKKK